MVGGGWIFGMFGDLLVYTFECKSGWDQFVTGSISLFSNVSRWGFPKGRVSFRRNYCKSSVIYTLHERTYPILRKGKSSSSCTRVKVDSALTNYVVPWSTGTWDWLVPSTFFPNNGFGWWPGPGPLAALIPSYSAMGWHCKSTWVHMIHWKDGKYRNNFKQLFLKSMTDESKIKTIESCLNDL